MNDLDDLRDAMHSTPGFEPRPLDLTQVMAAGGRMRRRRRITVGAASGLAVLVLLVGGAQLARPGTAQPAGQVAAGAPAGTEPPGTEPPGTEPPGTEPAGTEPSAGATVEDPAPTVDRPLGAVVDTGLTVEGLPRVLWMQHIDEPTVPDVALSIIAGRRTADGELLVDVANNEVEGSDRAPGFHAGEAAMVVDGGQTPAFGYYVGPAAKITVVADGRTVRAEHAAWSEDPSVIMFWFSLETVKPTSRIGRASAYDADGRRLPAGNPGFAVG